jgi:hypothetical protein
MYTQMPNVQPPPRSPGGAIVQAPLFNPMMQQQAPAQGNPLSSPGGVEQLMKLAQLFKGSGNPLAAVGSGPMSDSAVSNATAMQGQQGQSVWPEWAQNAGQYVYNQFR